MERGCSRVTGCILFLLVNDGERQGNRVGAVLPCAKYLVDDLSKIQSSHSGEAAAEAGYADARFKRMYTHLKKGWMAAGTLFAFTTNDDKQDEENQHKRETLEAAVEDTH
jgi:hypothetical protein